MVACLPLNLGVRHPPPPGMRKRLLFLWLMLTAGAPSRAWACWYSGPDAAVVFARLERPDYLPWSLSAIAVGAWFLVRRRVPMPRAWGIGLIGLVALQPAWWLPAHGDCGMLRMITGAATALLSGLTLIAGILRARRRDVPARMAGV